MSYNSRIRRIFTSSIILFPILNSAHIGDMNFGYGDVILILGYGLMLLAHARQFRAKFTKESAPFWTFIAYIGCISVINCLCISGFEFSSMLMPLIRCTFYGLILYTNRRYVDYEFGLNLYINVCFLEAIYGLVQFALTLTVGINLPYVLPFTTMEYGSYGADYNATLLKTFQTVDGIRLVGFFPEASHFTQYTILSIIFLLFKAKKTRKDIIKLCVISVAIMLTKSSIGIIAYGFILVYYLITEKHVSAKKLLTRVSLIFAGVVVFLLISNHMDLIGFISERIRRVTEKTYAVSGNLRLVRGFLVFGQAPINIKLFGIGCGNYANFIDAYGISTFFDLVMDRTNEFMNAFSLLLIRSGIIGTVIFSVFLINLYRGLNRMQKLIFFVFLELLFTENIFFSPVFVLFIWFMQARLDGVLYGGLMKPRLIVGANQ